MKEKIELRKKLKSISLVNLVHSSHVIEKLNSYIKENIDQLVLDTQEKMNNVYKELTASIK